LTAVAQGVFAWLADPPAPGAPNAAAVIDADGITLIDTLMVAPQWEPFGEAVDELAGRAGVPIRRVVLTSSTIEHVGGTMRFWQAGFYGSTQISAHLDQPPDATILRRLYPEQGAALPDDLRTHPVTHVVTEPAFISGAVRVEPIRGPLDESLVAVVESVRVVLAGAVGCFEMAPLCYQGDPAAWADALDQVLAWGETVVPGHGPVGGPEQVRAQQAYLRACVDAAAAGAETLPAGPWDHWPGRAHDIVNIERAALLAEGRDEVPPTMLARAGLS
jgi:cyclase